MGNISQLKIVKSGVGRLRAATKAGDKTGDETRDRVAGSIEGAGGATANPHRLALERVRDLIGTDQIRTSGRLPAERRLAADLGLGRRSLRHALDVLEAEGRITRHQGRGTFVTDARLGTQSLVRELAKLNNPVDTLEARLAIEPPQARLAALRATRGDIDKLFQAAEAS